MIRCYNESLKLKSEGILNKKVLKDIIKVCKCSQCKGVKKKRKNRNLKKMLKRKLNKQRRKSKLNKIINHYWA